MLKYISTNSVLIKPFVTLEPKIKRELGEKVLKKFA
ncbi:MAG: hypothetical protein Ct9H90mP7_3600 [Candidatus Neomarinimicrobiota bacterium]|nr:MAG: hypothetical protein Ct9H90mP7_3600 [Candidatus Neomarinimicrobiota bacterium]